MYISWFWHLRTHARTHTCCTHTHTRCIYQKCIIRPDRITRFISGDADAATAKRLACPGFALIYSTDISQ